MLKSIMEDIEKKQSITESVKYPTQEEAEYCLDMNKAIDSIVWGDGPGEMAKKAGKKIKAAYREFAEYAIGDNSPWRFDQIGTSKLSVVWDDKKAEKLGINK